MWPAPLFARISVGMDVGYVFLARDLGIPCFVPDIFVSFSAEGAASIDQVAYLQSG